MMNVLASKPSFEGIWTRIAGLCPGIDIALIQCGVAEWRLTESTTLKTLAVSVL
ncbi:MULTISPECIES: hypothetical protein [unclassified Chelatococcus]|uniref:hypothetical protein n=1 Tax=unclassified Chelatococcus TaxID=2638111 RepID=UPI001BCFE0B5|nr:MULTISPECIES: hypothetical protein [unclassified Chelatococcus]MBS7743765.1 hypothetical protein [Chelatococcus sp. HY11]MBX3547418.1 hypothetical protein [Chelatococcus sp.]